MRAFFFWSVCDAYKVPRTGDVSPVQPVEMMEGLAHEINAAVVLVNAPPFCL